MPPLSTTLAQAVKHHKAGDWTQAEGIYREILREQPDHPDALYLLGVLAKQTGRADLAMSSIAKAAAVNTTNPAYYTNLGNALRKQGRLDKAITHFHRAIELNPNFAEAHMSLAAALQERGELRDALACYDRGLALHPFDPEARLARGLIHLQTGNLREGWAQYEWRWRSRQGSPMRSLAQHFWDGEPLTDKTLLIHAEETLSDQIMFASCVPDMLAAARHCVIACDPRLTLLFARSFPAATIYSTARSERNMWNRTIQAADLRIAMGSIPRYCRQELADFPQHGGYLLPDPSARQKWWARFASLGEGLKVGISWRGGSAARSQQRSTQLQQWLPVLACADVQFINLQAGECTAELSELAAEHGVTIHDLAAGPSPPDCDQLAGKIAALDLVISVPNTIAHLAGALGVEVWNLLAPWSSWRWMLDREDSPWYPNMWLLRCNSNSGWSEVFLRAAQRLQVRAAKRPASNS